MLTRCPNCGASMSLDALASHQALRETLAEVICMLPGGPAAGPPQGGGSPLGGQRTSRSGEAWGRLLLRYLGLFRPAKRELRPERSARLLRDLLPDVQRGAITRRGRDWAVPPPLWQAALEAVLDAADKGNLQPPLADHGYLYEVLMRLADKQEGAQEQQREQERRSATRPGAVQLAGQALSLGDAISRDPVLKKIDDDARRATPMPAAVRAQLQQLKKGQKP